MVISPSWPTLCIVHAGNILWLLFSLYGVGRLCRLKYTVANNIFEKFNYQRLFFTADMDKYETPDQYCLPPNYKPETDVFFMYVEVTLLGCKYLCQNLHDLQCSLIVYMPFKRSCVLQPDVRVHWVQCEENSIKVEIHRRRRTTGMPHTYDHEWRSPPKQLFILMSRHENAARHYIDLIMTTMASQITSLAVVYSSFIQAQIKENIKAPRHWPLCGEFAGTGEFPAQRTSNAENVSI